MKQIHIYCTRKAIYMKKTHMYWLQTACYNKKMVIAHKKSLSDYSNRLLFSYSCVAALFFYDLLRHFFAVFQTYGYLVEACL